MNICVVFHILTIPIFPPDAFRKHVPSSQLIYEVKKRSQELAESITNNPDF